jgi:phosphopantothenoylcysteine decarboxylase/phosphopantothenate--cysteine ligase
VKRVVLGVSGSVAAYRAADLARDLMRAGCEVRVCLTDAAQEFVRPALFEALTGQPCLIDTFEEPERGRIAHIDWARQADLLLIAPASANTLAKIAEGRGDDMLSTLALAYEGPLLIAPAMNPAMYLHPATQTHLKSLQERGAWMVEPAEGDVACGENGQGKLASNARIVEESLAALADRTRLEGKHVVITSGPTQEAIDDVRFLSNRSSGKMGAAMAQVALNLGARVTVISGPTDVPLPRTAEVVRVRTALEMRDAAISAAKDADWIVGVAAVADYRPANPMKGKMRRNEDSLTLELVANPDIIAELAATNPQAKTIAFAAEPTSDSATALEKLVRKGVFALAMNDISNPSIGFESGENELTLLTQDGAEHRSGRRTKLGCARWLWDALLG